MWYLGGLNVVFEWVILSGRFSDILSGLNVGFKVSDWLFLE